MLLRRCSLCAYWLRFAAAMERVQSDWADRPVPVHSCIDKAKEN